jgi:hypothetical protein
MPLKFSESEKKLPLGRTIAGVGARIGAKKAQIIGQKKKAKKKFCACQGEASK